MRTLAVVWFVLISGLVSWSDDKAKPEPKMVKFLNINRLEPNTVGKFGQLDKKGTVVLDPMRVISVVDKNVVIASHQYGTVGKSSQQQVYITNIDTTDLVDGKMVPYLVYKVIGTKKIDNKTYHHVEVWTGKYTPPK